MKPLRRTILNFVGALACNLCSQMPRLGHSGMLSEQQIKDLVAYLVDPESPVNK